MSNPLNKDFKSMTRTSLIEEFRQQQLLADRIIPGLGEEDADYATLDRCLRVMEKIVEAFALRNGYIYED